MALSNFLFEGRDTLGLFLPVELITALTTGLYIDRVNRCEASREGALGYVE